MISSLKQLFKAPYNTQKPGYALYRFFTWKAIRALKLKKITFNIWGDRKVYLYHDSVQSSWIMYNYWVDWKEFNAIKDLVRPGDTVLDIGSNIGSYVLWFSKFTGGEGEIHAFEPDPHTFSLLSENIALNNIDNQVIKNKLAISNKTGELKFTIGLDIQNQIVSDQTSTCQTIDCTTIDSYVALNNITKIRYLKIDIEGFEYRALLGAKETLSQQIIEVIQLEINEKISNSGVTPDELLSFTSGLGYILCEYIVSSKQFSQIKYQVNKENYFLVLKDKVVK